MDTYDAGSTIYLKFNTANADGPITLAGSPAIAVYKNATTTESTSGVTLNVNFDSKTGYHNVTIDTSADGTFYANGGVYSVVLSAGTIDGVSVAYNEIGKFELKANYPTASNISDTVWDEATLSHGGTGTFSELIIENLDSKVSDIPSVVEIDGRLSTTHGSGSWAVSGNGSKAWSYTVTDTSTSMPLSDANVTLTSDSIGNNVIVSGTTDAFGVVTFYLNIGTYYVWTEKAGYNFTNPDIETVV